MATGSAVAAPKPNGARIWLCRSRCPCPNPNRTMRAAGMAFRLALRARLNNPSPERRWRVGYLSNEQLKKPLDAIRDFYACPAHAVSPGVYGTQGSNRPGARRWRMAWEQPTSDVK